MCWSTPNTCMLGTQPRTSYSFEFPFLLETDSIPLELSMLVWLEGVFFKIPVGALYLYVFILFFFKSFHTWSTDSYWKIKNEIYI